MAWQCISPEVTVQSFKKCCISSPMDGTADDMFQHESLEDRNVRSVGEEDEGTDCEGGDLDTDW